MAIRPYDGAKEPNTADPCDAAHKGVPDSGMMHLQHSSATHSRAQRYHSLGAKRLSKKLQHVCTYTRTLESMVYSGMQSCEEQAKILSSPQPHSLITQPIYNRSKLVSAANYGRQAL